MVKKQKQSRKRRQTRKHRGGGSGYEPGGALNPGAANGLVVNRSYDSCMSASRPGQLSFSPAAGLAGMKGGRYTTNLSSSIAGFPTIDKIPCSANHVNPYNKQSGGVGVASSKDMGVYEAHPARYTSAPSQWTGSTGAPVLLNQGLSGTAWSKSCSQTAGSRKRRGRKGMRGGGDEEILASLLARQEEEKRIRAEITARWYEQVYKNKEAEWKAAIMAGRITQQDGFRLSNKEYEAFYATDPFRHVAQVILTPEERRVYASYMEKKFGRMWMYQ